MIREFSFRDSTIILAIVIMCLSVSLTFGLDKSQISDRFIINDLNGSEVDYSVLGFSSEFEQNELFIFVAERVAESSMNNTQIEEELDFDKYYKELIPIFREKYSEEKDREYSSNEYIQSFQELINNDYKGDCDDYAIFLYVLANKLNLEVRYMVGRNKEYAHAWIQIYKNGTWYEYDSTSYLICDDDCISKDYDVIDYF